MSLQRRAVIDVGTNSVKLLIADVAGNDVQPVLEDSFAGTDLGVHAVYPEGPRPPGKVRAFVDLLVQQFRRPAW